MINAIQKPIMHSSTRHVSP